MMQLQEPQSPEPDWIEERSLTEGQLQLLKKWDAIKADIRPRVEPTGEGKVTKSGGTFRFVELPQLQNMIHEAALEKEIAVKADAVIEQDILSIRTTLVDLNSGDTLRFRADSPTPPDPSTRDISRYLASTRRLAHYMMLDITTDPGDGDPEEAPAEEQFRAPRLKIEGKKMAAAPAKPQASEPKPAQTGENAAPPTGPRIRQPLGNVLNRFDAPNGNRDQSASSTPGIRRIVR